MSEPELEQNADVEHRVTPLELFFDLAFVFGFTQVTTLLVDDPSWGGIFRGMLVLAALWWAWTGFAWFTSTLDVDEGGVRLAMLAAMAAVFAAALAVPGAFGDDALLFGFAYLFVRVLHIVLYAIVSKDDPDLRGALLRLAPSELLGALLLVVAGLLDGDAQIAAWVVALAVDYLGPAFNKLDGWRIAPEHFAERHGLIILIALGESLIAIGVGAGFELVPRVMIAAGLGLVVVSALWWLYFDVAAIFQRMRLVEAGGVEQVREALASFSYLHLPMVAGIVLFAFGLEDTLHHVDDTLATVPAAALCGGAALYLLGHVVSLFRATRRVFRRRTIGGLALLALIPVATAIPALAALALVGAVCSSVVAYEAIAHREHRVHVRHPELAD
ncbi:MAG TPA: low temperature requirement protein A [Gaiellaceae bacterium]|nr:low temperature requirement protein A [Gaiellaceae bacterium]